MILRCVLVMASLDLERLSNPSIWSIIVYGCKEQDLTSSSNWIRVLGFGVA